MKLLIFRIIDILFFPFTVLTALWLKFLTTIGLYKTIIGRRTFLFFGVLPVRDHYYQPLINPEKHIEKSLRTNRFLPGIDLNTEYQLELLSKFNYNEELLTFPIEKTTNKLWFYYNNGSFGSGDAEYLYNILRYYKPAKLIEIGSGNSTLIAIKALERNKEENPAYSFEHVCIEPYEQPWLEESGVIIKRKKVETIDISLFESLNRNDILFIDSSHIIRPQGDVLFEYLEILPVLKSGVIIHIHDIFTPRDYPDDWILKEHRLWNEQYLLEAFLSLNNSFEIIGALNYLTHHYREALSVKCPVFAKQKNREPGSLWIRRK
ncbi:MAG: class I SAM-dependent methyltransferase [Daejeonella sp.]